MEFYPSDFQFFLKTLRSINTTPSPKSSIDLAEPSLWETLPAEVLQRTFGNTGVFDDIDRAVVVRLGMPFVATSAVVRDNGDFYRQMTRIFYSDRTLMLLFLGDRPIAHHIEDCLEWLDKIGVDCASELRGLVIVYSREQHRIKITRNLLPQMYQRGVQNAPGGSVVRLKKVSFQFRQRRREMKAFMKKLPEWHSVLFPL